LRGIVKDIRARSAELHAIGSGSPEQAAEFAKERELDFDLYVNPDLTAYEAAGLRRTVGATMSLRVFANAARALRAGFRQGRTQGDNWQQGGVFVIAPDGRVPLAQISQVAGDHAAPEEILRALDSLTEKV
jgi:peroxiredoxin